MNEHDRPGAATGERRDGAAAAAGPSSSVWPSVTAVIPTVGRDLLDRAVSAVLRQDYPGEIECLVVLDGPDLEDLAGLADRCGGVPERRRLRTVRNTRTKGLAGARNSGMLAATGDLVATCDDDDEWDLTKTRVQVARMLAEPDAILSSTGIVVHHGDKALPRVPDEERLTLTDLLRRRVMEVGGSTFMAWRARVLAEVGLVDEDLPGSYAEDYDWLLRVAHVAPVVVVREPLSHIHWHGSSYYFGRWQMIVDALRYLLAKHPEFREVPAGLARVEGQIAFAYAGMGRRGDALTWARRALRGNRREPRAWAAVLAGTGILTAPRIQAMAHRLGRGI